MGTEREAYSLSEALIHDRMEEKEEEEAAKTGPAAFWRGALPSCRMSEWPRE